MNINESDFLYNQNLLPYPGHKPLIQFYLISNDSFSVPVYSVNHFPLFFFLMCVCGQVKCPPVPLSSHSVPLLFHN